MSRTLLELLDCSFPSSVCVISIDEPLSVSEWFDCQVHRGPTRADPAKVSNSMILKYKKGLKILFYGDYDFQKLDDDDVKQFQEDLNKKAKWYVVSYGKIGTIVVTKILDDNQISESNIPLFDENEHFLLDAMTSPGSSPKASPSKRFAPY